MTVVGRFWKRDPLLGYSSVYVLWTLLMMRQRGCHFRFRLTLSNR